SASEVGRRGVGERAVGVEVDCAVARPRPQHRAQRVVVGIAVIAQYPRDTHRQSGVLGGAVDIIGRGRSIVGGGDRDRHDGHIGGQAAVVGSGGEGVVAVEGGRGGGCVCAEAHVGGVAGGGCGGGGGAAGVRSGRGGCS